MFSLLLFRAQREEEAAGVHQLREHLAEVERNLEDKERELASMEEEREADGQQLEEVKREAVSHVDHIVFHRI